MGTMGIAEAKALASEIAKSHHLNLEECKGRSRWVVFALGKENGAQFVLYEVTKSDNSVSFCGYYDGVHEYPFVYPITHSSVVMCLFVADFINELGARYLDFVTFLHGNGDDVVLITQGNSLYRLMSNGQVISAEEWREIKKSIQVEKLYYNVR